ncbi:MAG: choice-of-anchor X domain-containing protein [Dokdonella sp.]|uniref:choice-of-anchor X domain-containing protein n=1 Tax=Dokdonella sp. TaxID=2291710 RepID=UPI0032646B27
MSTIFRRPHLAALILLALTAPLHASDIPQNIGYGLDTLVRSNAALRLGAPPGQALYNGYATEAAANYASQAITEANSGRVMVDILLTGKVAMDDLKTSLASKIPSLSILATDPSYRSSGILEGYVAIDDVAALAQDKGVRSVFLALKPRTYGAGGPTPNVVPGDHLNKIGTAFDQGVVQHRVDRINQIYNPAAPVNWDGSGISIAAMSDSYDTRTANPHAAAGVTNFDLPGAANNPVNTQPVVVLVDGPPGSTDEGRGMVEILHKMAPRARLAFASGFLGEVAFAESIRQLADLPGHPGTQGFKADVITDDIGYGGEPYYGESIIGAAIDEVAAAGVSYFSSAGNDIGINAYESSLRIVPGGTGVDASTNSALANTNINLTGVPAALYAGGFHNFNPLPGQLDVAQLVNMPAANQNAEMQWDDPYDQRPAVLDQPAIYSATGTISTAVPSVTFDATSTPPLPVFTHGTVYVIQETAISGDIDGIVNIYDASNTLIVSQDTGTDETVQFYPPTTGQYRIVIGRFATTAGTFSLTINTAQATAGVTTDLNLLVFRADTGAYLAQYSLTSNNVANNRPVEIGALRSPTGQTQIQFAIARSNVPPANVVRPTRVRWQVGGNGAAGIGPAEYFKYNATTTKGHATAKGCNGTAAYSVFRPNLPESFTSPGPATILFDRDSNRLATPDIRQQPRVAAADAANGSFFSGDSTADLDTNPNFSGTSAAAPHAAAIAALVLQSRGGPRSVPPTQMTSILQASAFPHDLDPSSASGTALTSDGVAAVVLSIDSDNDSNGLTGSNDVNSFKLSFVGPGSLASLSLNPAGTAQTGGHVTGGNHGVMNDVGSSPATVSYFENDFPGLVFLPATKAFTLGTLSGVTAADITAPVSILPYTGFSNLAGAPSNGTSQFWTMSIGFPTAQFTDGKTVRFTVGRGAQHSATTGNGTVIGPGTVTSNPIADLFGGGVKLPSGVVNLDGMAFSGTTTEGASFAGVIRNQIGHGYSPVDGYGFINAEAAVQPAASNPSGLASATPSAVLAGDTSLLTVAVIPGANPPSTGIAVIADLGSIAGSTTQAFFDDGTHGDVTAGDGTYSYAATIPVGTPAGNRTFAVTITDAQSRSGSASIALSVLAPPQPTSPSGSAAASPSSVSIGASTLLSVVVTPGTNPLSSGIAVSGDLTGIGGSGTQAFFDDGTNGDIAAGDGVWSYAAIVGASTTPGSHLIGLTISDAQARSGFATLTLDVLASTALTATGAATPATLAITESTLLTVTTVAGANPPSSGVAVTADLSAIGGAASTTLFDDGTHGDATAGDGVFSLQTTVPLGTLPGTKVIPATVTDAQSRSASVVIALTVQTPVDPAGVGSATPDIAPIGASSLLTVTVTPGTTPASTGITVAANLASIGGSATQAFYDDGTHGDTTAGDGVHSFNATVAAGTAAGAKVFAVTISDAQARTGDATIGLSVPATDAPTATGLATPSTVGQGGSTVLIVAVTPGSNPASSGLVVTADLTAIGGSATQSFYDDGTHGDDVAGDRVFTFATAVSATASAGSVTLPVTVADAQGRSASASIALTISDVIFRNGFE